LGKSETEKKEKNLKDKLNEILDLNFGGLKNLIDDL
jgi:hypothetical protein